MLSLAIIALIFLGLQSAILLATRAMPDARSAQNLKAEAAAALQQISTDLTYATAVTKATATELTVVVPDRDGDNNPDTIKYVWSGAAGADLTRQFNAAPAVTIARAVQSLTFTYESVTQTGTSTSGTYGPEVLLASYDPPGNLLTSILSPPQNYGIDSTHWIGECFRPTLAANATGWSVTRVKFAARRLGTAAGTAYVQIRPTVGNVPATEVLAQTTVAESSLGSGFAWQDITLTGASGLTPGAGASLVIQWATGADAGEIAYDNSSVANINLTTTASAGSTWTAWSGSELFFYAYGRVQTPDTPAAQTVLRSVRCTLKTTGNQTLDTKLRAVNEPLVTP